MNQITKQKFNLSAERMIENTIVRLKSIDSTNNYANSMIRGEHCPEGTVFLAYEQTVGRGQVNNYWESEPGKNLTFSIVLYPDFLEIRHQFMLSKVVTLGIFTALSKYVGNLTVKWPNDIYAGDKKLGGILIENSVMYGLLKSSVAGIGLNVNQTVFVSNAPNPVSLKMLTNEDYDTDNVLMEILSGINSYYAILKSDAYERINNEFLSVLYRINETHFFRSSEETFQGKIIGVNEIGQLLIERTDGKILDFHFKEVEFLQA